MSEDITELQLQLDKAGQIGLTLVDENTKLKQDMLDLDSLNQQLKKELVMAKKALEIEKNTSKKQSIVGAENEMDLINQCVTREEELLGRISELERENKVLSSDYGTHNTAMDSLLQQIHNLTEELNYCKESRSSCKRDLKEVKQREHSINKEYNDLTEENICLQKQITYLKQSVWTLDSLRHEKYQLEEQNDIVISQLEEQLRLKQIVERRLEEALEQLKVDRENKQRGLKKDLDDSLSGSIYKNWNSIARVNKCTGAGASSSESGEEPTKCEEEEEEGDKGEKDEDETTKMQRELFMMEESIYLEDHETAPGNVSFYRASSCESSLNGDNKRLSIFDEIRDDKVSGLEAIVEKLRDESLALGVKLEEAEKSRDGFQKELKSVRDLLELKSSQLQKVLEVESLAAANQQGEAIKNHHHRILREDDGDQVTELKKQLRQQEHKYAVALRQMSDMQCELRSLLVRDKIERLYTTDEELKGEIVRLNSGLEDVDCQLKQSKHYASTLESSLRQLREGILLNKSELEVINEDMTGVCQQLSVFKNAPSFVQKCKSDDNDVDYSFRLIDRQRQFLQCLKQNIALLNSNANSGADSSDYDKSVEDDVALQKQVNDLQSQLALKRDQIITLRSVMKANKCAAESAISNMKQKYDSDRSTVTETMLKLRGELKALKEDAATFASLRAMFAARCDEYVTQLDEMQQKLQSSEDERRTLNSLLRMAIQQKLSIAERLQELEMEREQVMHNRVVFPSPTSSQNPNVPYLNTAPHSSGVAAPGPFNAINTLRQYFHVNKAAAVTSGRAQTSSVPKQQQRHYRRSVNNHSNNSNH